MNRLLILATVIAGLIPAMMTPASAAAGQADVAPRWQATAAPAPAGGRHCFDTWTSGRRSGTRRRRPSFVLCVRFFLVSRARPRPYTGASPGGRGPRFSEAIRNTPPPSGV